MTSRELGRQKDEGTDRVFYFFLSSFFGCTYNTMVMSDRGINLVGCKLYVMAYHGPLLHAR